MRSNTRALLVSLLASCAPFEEPRLQAGPETAAPAPPLARSTTRALPPCPDGRDALRTGTSLDGFACETLGPDTALDAPLWPAVDDLVGPVFYVRSDAPTGGDGSLARPYDRVARALAEHDGGAIVVARGAYALEALTFTGAWRVRGAGASATRLSGPRGWYFNGAATVVSLSGLRIELPPGDADAVALDVTAARVDLVDVAVLGGATALRSTAATVSASGFAVSGTTSHAVLARGGSLDLARFALRDGAQQGIRAEAAHLRLRRGAVTGFARHGVALLGEPLRGTGFARCNDASLGGALDCLDQVTLADDAVAALYVEGTRDVEGSRLALASTRLAAVAGGSAGDGLFVGARARVTLDPDILSVAERGFGTAIVGNARAGALVQGVSARLTVRGALVTANGGGAVLVGRDAELPFLGESLLEANRVGGVIATPGALVGIMQCNGIVDTQMGTLTTSTGAVTLGDALQLDATVGEVTLRDNVLSGSARFGVVLHATRAAGERNRGDDNRYGVGLYAGASLRGDLGPVLGRERAPSLTPSLAGAL